MDFGAVFDAVLLGFIEGLTEFIPVSSTGHILLAGHFLGFKSTAGTFEVLIQLGAVLAVLSVYFGKLWRLLVTLPSSPDSRRFVTGILLAFLPAAFIGFLAHDFIKTVLFESPMTICIALIVGGILLLAIDRVAFKWPGGAAREQGIRLLVLDRKVARPLYTDVMDYPLSLCLKIGFFQCLAMIPGTSRSGATIAGALLMGTDKRSAAEFSFFLAMPTMAGAFALDLYKNRNVLSTDDLSLIAIGFVVSFVTALFVVKYLLDFVSRHGFAPFAWWRIAVGTLGLLGLLLVG